MIECQHANKERQKKQSKEREHDSRRRVCEHEEECSTWRCRRYRDYQSRGDIIGLKNGEEKHVIDCYTRCSLHIYSYTTFIMLTSPLYPLLSHQAQLQLGHKISTL